MNGDDHDEILSDARRHGRTHRAEVLASDVCGCYFCLAVYRPAEIAEWIGVVEGVGQTAVCPRCGVDAVVGSAAGFPMTRAFLVRMYERWYAGCS